MITSSNVKLLGLFLIFVAFDTSFFLQLCLAFITPEDRCVVTSTFMSVQSKKSAKLSSQLPMTIDANNGEKHNESKEDQPNSGGPRNNNNCGAHDEDWESLQIRIARMRLEEENKRRFLKSRPVKLPYDQSKKWVQAQNMWNSREEWYEWVGLGENLSAYIPSDPEAYYKGLGSWIDWDDYLGC